MAKNSDDGVQIVEQILPYFQPDYGITINAVPSMDIIRDIPVVLNSTGYEDTYDGDFMTRRALIYTFEFSAKTFMYGPVITSSVIKKVDVDQYADLKEKAPPRVRQYSVSGVEKAAGADEDDNFGFTETLSEWV